MVELEYILDVEALRIACQSDDAQMLPDYAFLELEMPARLRIGDVDVFGHSADEYEQWMRSLANHNLPSQVPLPAWTLLPVLSLAISSGDAFARLNAQGHADIDAIDAVIWLEQQRGPIVEIYMSRDRIGRASLAELQAGFASFAERVRQGFLSVCPQLRDHATLGPWFKGVHSFVDSLQSQEIIRLPPATDQANGD